MNGNRNMNEKLRIKTHDKESTEPGSGIAMVQRESRRWYLCHSKGRLERE